MTSLTCLPVASQPESIRSLWQIRWKFKKIFKTVCCSVALGKIAVAVPAKLVRGNITENFVKNHSARKRPEQTASCLELTAEICSQ